MEVSERVSHIKVADTVVPCGRVSALRGQILVASGVRMAVGESGYVRLSPQRTVDVECVGFLEGQGVLLTPYHDITGIKPGLPVVANRRPLGIVTGFGVLGRLLDGIGRPLDNGPVVTGPKRFFDLTPVPPLSRKKVQDILWTGVKVIDAFLTLGQGQRVGIFAGAGFGKTTLLEDIIQGAEADIVVVGLIGERGREVAEFYRRLDPATKKRTVIFAATSDMPAIMRLKAAWSATIMAETFRDQGKHVLMVMDSLSRVALAQREIGMETGELPSARGYTPSVLHLLPRLLERAGAQENGSVTGIYTVLVEGDDAYDDPLADVVRGLLDGHIILSRQLAQQGHFPAVDVVSSLSRLMPDLVLEDQWVMARTLGGMVERVARARDLLEIGAYTVGRDRDLDRALATYPAIQAFCDQKRGTTADPEDTWRELALLFAEVERWDRAQEEVRGER